jgi:hypothetical protein
MGEIKDAVENAIWEPIWQFRFRRCLRKLEAKGLRIVTTGPDDRRITDLRTGELLVRGSEEEIEAVFLDHPDWVHEDCCPDRMDEVLSKFHEQEQNHNRPERSNT